MWQGHLPYLVGAAEDNSLDGGQFVNLTIIISVLDAHQGLGGCKVKVNIAHMQRFLAEWVQMWRWTDAFLHRRRLQATTLTRWGSPRPAEAPWVRTALFLVRSLPPLEAAFSPPFSGSSSFSSPGPASLRDSGPPLRLAHVSPQDDWVALKSVTPRQNKGSLELSTLTGLSFYILYSCQCFWKTIDKHP